MSKELRGVLLAVLGSALIGVGGAAFRLWEDVSLLKLKVELLEAQNTQLRDWLKAVSATSRYYHGDMTRRAETPNQ